MDNSEKLATQGTQDEENLWILMKINVFRSDCYKAGCILSVNNTRKYREAKVSIFFKINS